MDKLEIGTLGLDGNQSWLQVLGEGRHELISSAKYSRSLSDKPEVEEELLLFFRGNLPDLEGILRFFREIIQAAKSRLPGLPQLNLKTYLGAEAFFSPILEAALEDRLEAAENIALGTLQLRLLLKRRNFFQTGEVELPLTVPGGSSQTGGTLLYNHEDLHPGHHASVVVNTASLNSGLPVALRAELINNYNGAHLGTLRLGLLCSKVMGYFPQLDFEAEAGSVLSPIASGADSGGESVLPTWSGNDWTSLLRYPIADLDLALLNQVSLIPIVRLSSRPSDLSLRFRLRLSADGATLYLGEPSGLPPQGNLVVLPACHLQQYTLPGMELPAVIAMDLEAVSSAAGAHSIALDSLRLLPHNHSVEFSPVSGLAFGGKLIDQPERNLAWSQVNGHELQTHLRFGEDLVIPAGSYGKLFIQGESITGQAEIERSFSLRVWGSTRRQIL